MSAQALVVETVRWKLNRAREISEALDALFGEFSQSNFYAIGQKIDRKKRLCLVLQDVQPFPPYYSLMLSEAIHHLRSSLDHLAWALSRPQTTSQKKRIGFPICSKSKGFRDVIAGNLLGASPKAVRYIESIQPYHSRRSPELRYLALLRDLSNWDKHSAISAVGAAIHDSHIDISVTGGTSIAKVVTYRGAIKNENVVARILPGASEVGATMQFHPAFSVYPVFDESMPKSVRNKGVGHTINGAGALIQETILPAISTYL